MLVYHGSSNKFSQFDYNRIRLHGTSEGIGFYFTNSLGVARKYGSGGYIYAVEFSGRRSLNSTCKTITVPQLRMYISNLNMHLDYLSNYGDVRYSGLNSVLTACVKSEYMSATTDVELIDGICNASGDIECCLKVLYETLGYDSIVLQGSWGLDLHGCRQIIYVALVPDIIKIIGVSRTMTGASGAVKMRVLSARINGRHVKKITAVTMEGVWSAFNRYAKQKGYIRRVEGGIYLGGMAWANNSGDIMDIVRIV